MSCPRKAISQKSRSHANGVKGAPAQAQRKAGLRGERRSSGMSELSALAGSEGYGACDDEGDWGTPQQAANRPAPRKRRSGGLKPVSAHRHCLPVRPAPAKPGGGTGLMMWHEFLCSFSPFSAEQTPSPLFLPLHAARFPTCRRTMFSAARGYYPEQSGAHPHRSVHTRGRYPPR